MMATANHDSETIGEWLTARIASELKKLPDSIALDEAFANIGLSSLDTLIICGELGEFLGIEDLSPSLFWDYPSINKLAEHLAQQHQTNAGA